MNHPTEYTKEQRWHREANLLPLMPDDELRLLAEDIEQHGLQQPIVLFEGKVLDGRNRLRACEMKGIRLSSKDFIQFHSNGLTAHQFVRTTNLLRRQLKLDQRAAIAAELVPIFAATADKGGRPKKFEKRSATVREDKKGKKSSELAAEFVGGLGGGKVGPRTVETVISLERKALEKKAPRVLARIKEGTLSIADARREIDALYIDTKPLVQRYKGAPPFTVFDCRSGEWLKRKKKWSAKGVTGGHNQQLSGNTTNDVSGGTFSDTSRFDPVLAEFVYDHFCPRRGRVLDPLAGEAVKGLVAAVKGLEYTGIEVRPEQVEENRRRAKKLGLTPKWVHGDSTLLEKEELIPKDAKYDLIFTSPPYFDLEKYSLTRADGSTIKTYREFMKWLEDVFTQAVTHLEPKGFLVIKVGEIRDKRETRSGFLYNFVGDTVSLFLKLGLSYYNEAILATSLGTAGQKAWQFEASKKLVHTHQNVLFFIKGDDSESLVGELCGRQGKKR